MRWHSTSESARNGEPSVLAIVETLAAMTLSVWIAVHFGTWIHVILGACVAPFLLLRTEESCVRSIRWLRQGAFWLGGGGGLGLFAAFLALPVLGIAVRVASTLAQVFSSPLCAVRSIPENWWRQAVSMDSAVSPEWLPTPVHSASAEGKFREFSSAVYSYGSDFFRALRESTHSVGKGVWALMLALLLILLGPTAFAYRWSIKSTAIIWFPLLWALRPPKPADRDWRTHLEIQRTLKMPQLVAVVSAISLTSLVLKYVSWAAGHDLAQNADALHDRFVALGWKTGGGSLAEVITAFVRPGAIPLWQVAMGFNGLLGLFVWWEIRSWLAHYQHNHPPSDAAISRTLGVAFFFRHILTSYIIICDGYMILQAARKLPFPEIGWKLFPWV